jgi:membrane-bound lytic murein transglycosylase A
MLPAPELEPIAFDALECWQADDPAAALGALLKSLEIEPGARPGLLHAARAAADDSGAARDFFEAWYTPHRVKGEAGFVTGYYEPRLRGSRRRQGRFQIPVYAKPDDLVMLKPDLERARWNSEMSAARRSGDGPRPYFTRAEIDAGALSGRGLELLFLDDPVALFYMQVQGSGLVELEEGGEVRLSYAAKNGHAYISIGKLLIERGEIAAGEMSMAAVKAWLAADASRGRALMQENRSYVFFRELDAGVDGPIGAQGATLTPGRSLAVDGSLYRMGTPIFVSVSALTDEHEAPFARLMVAQDVGSAIRGVQRGDIFWGSGEAAGALAGVTRHAAHFTVLLPNGAAADG